MVSIPKDASQFRLQHLFWMMFSFASSAGVYQLDSDSGLPCLILTSVFWAGCVMLVIADSIDKRPIDEKQLLIQLMNVVGALMIGASGVLLILWIGVIAFFAFSYLIATAF